MQSALKSRLLLKKCFFQHNRKSLLLQKYNSVSNINSSQGGGRSKYDNNKSYVKYIAPAALLSITGAATLKYYLDNQNKSNCASKVAPTKYSRDEVSNHKTKETGVWVIYGNNIYDITDFIEGHPGGSNKIILAAGGNLEPYWDMYAIHKKPEIISILQGYYIGELRKEDWIVEEKKQGPFANDPKRHPALIANSKEPFNAETPPVLAADSLITPNDLFYVRNHLPVPDIDVNNFNLHIEGNGLSKKVSLTVDELKKYKKTSVVAAVQCAGNRRSEMNPIKKVKGLSWSSNAISNAEWSGVLLIDLLKDLGFDENSKDVKHIHFEGADEDPTGAVYGASIPADKIIKKNLPIMIAYEMNGEPIPRDHGFPLRLVAPGIVGARSVKWLKHIKLSDKEYQGHWQQNDYKPFSPNIDWHNVDFKSSPAIQDLPVTSAICYPPIESVFDESEEEVVLKGYAFSGGGRGIIRVDLSNDDGKTWFTAELTQADQDIDDMYSWTLWSCAIPIPKDHKGKMDVVCKAVDSSCNTQPENVGPVWNLRGVLNNAWHRTNFKIEKDDD